MGTAEILIVFSALMALISLVTIGIDWIGKPLKHRRFIPRMYRFEDEKLPVDEYGNTAWDAIDGAYEQPPQPVLVPYMQPAPPPPGYLPRQPGVPIPANPSPDSSDTRSIEADRANPTVVVPMQAPPRQVAQIDPELAASSTASRSAFTDSLAQAAPDAAGTQSSSGESSGELFGHATIAGTTAATSSKPQVEQAWRPGMALDTTVDDQKPSLAIKAERFWISTAEASETSHFDADDIARMALGKAPRRSNPRTGKTEAMQLTGLRQASQRADVRMKWPDEAVDPWSTSS